MTFVNGRIALVTGASSGIGEATVATLLEKGITVYAAARRLDRMAGLAAKGARLLALDLTDDPSMVAAVDQIRTEVGRLDILVNNAGYGSYGALEDVPLDEARRQFEVNVFGAARLIQLVLPTMREQRSGRIVNVSSIAGVIWEPFGSWYHASKFALEGLSDCLRAELSHCGIDVVVIQPGPIRTEWNSIAAQSLVQVSGEGAYGPYARRYAVAALTKHYEGRSISLPQVVADAISLASTVRKPRTRYVVGDGAKLVLAMKRVLSSRMFDGLMWTQAKAKS